MGWGRHGGGGESDKWWQIVLQVGDHNSYDDHYGDHDDDDDDYD